MYLVTNKYQSYVCMKYELKGCYGMYFSILDANYIKEHIDSIYWYKSVWCVVHINL